MLTGNFKVISTESRKLAWNEHLFLKNSGRFFLKSATGSNRESDILESSTAGSGFLKWTSQRFISWRTFFDGDKLKQWKQESIIIFFTINNSVYKNILGELCWESYSNFTSLSIKFTSWLKLYFKSMNVELYLYASCFKGVHRLDEKIIYTKLVVWQPLIFLSFLSCSRVMTSLKHYWEC